MDNKELIAKTYRALDKADMSLREHFVLCQVGLCGPSYPSGFVEECVAYGEGDPRGEFTEAEYAQALQNCLKKQWLKIWTAEECQEEYKRQEASPCPKLWDWEVEAGVLDFTPAGFFLQRQVLLDIFGLDHIQRKDCGWKIDRERQEINVYAATQALCLRMIEALQSSPNTYIGGTAVILRIDPPEVIGAWKPNRYLTLPMGYHAGVIYRRTDADKRPD